MTSKGFYDSLPRSMAESKTSVRRLEALERQLQALELRKAGLSYPVIADKLGYASASGAYQAVESAIQKVLEEPAEKVRKMALSRLDSFMLSIWPKLREGDLTAIDRALKIEERRAKLLGLDKIQVHATVDLGLEAIVRRAEELSSRYPDIGDLLIEEEIVQ